MLQRLWSDLGVGILHAVVHQHHDENRNGDPEVSNDPAELKHKITTSLLIGDVV